MVSGRRVEDDNGPSRTMKRVVGEKGGSTTEALLQSAEKVRSLTVEEAHSSRSLFKAELGDPDEGESRPIFWKKDIWGIFRSGAQPI